MIREPSSRRIGLARTLSKAGYCSRSAAFALIRAGRVSVNGVRSRDPEKPVRFEHDHIEVDGRPLPARVKAYIMLNKPRGVVTTVSDERGRETVYASLDPILPWVAPVGRLDKASEGLLLLTNDSEWAARILDPETHLEKTYHVQIASVIDEGLLAKLVEGTPSGFGEVLRAKEVRILRQGEKNTWLEIVLDEGKNRQIRRMLGALGIEVLRIVRVAIGPLVLGTLRKGLSRPLTAREKDELDGALRAKLP